MRETSSPKQDQRGRSALSFTLRGVERVIAIFLRLQPAETMTKESSD
ncbi:MAG: hypothetical protein WC654_02790 [Patescibacteria group bacterium]